MTIQSNWRTLVDERQRKEISLAEVYATDFNHGTTGHNAYILIARLAELLDVAVGVKQMPLPPEPAEVKLTFGKHSGRTLGELMYLDEGYVEWLAREARDEALRAAAQQVLATPIDDLVKGDEDDPPY